MTKCLYKPAVHDLNVNVKPAVTVMEPTDSCNMRLHNCGNINFNNVILLYLGNSLAVLFACNYQSRNF